MLTVLMFLITGQWMRHHEPPMGALSDAARLMFRSRHIYILASGLVNLMLGLYLHRQMAGWRAFAQIAGSGLLMVSPVLLTLGFVVEPERGFQEGIWCSAAGLYAVFLGCVGHFTSGVSKPTGVPLKEGGREARPHIISR